MKNSAGFPQLFLRIALGLGFIFPVMDRLGYMGLPGSKNAAWGDWAHFVNYTNVLIPFISHTVANFMSVLVSLAEAGFGICLIIGFKVRLVALGSAILTLIFAISMIFASGWYAPFQYPVFVFSGAAFLLSGLGEANWSLDKLLSAKSKS